MPRKRDRVGPIEGDGEFLLAEFQLPSTGEWVVGAYQLIGWRRPPAAYRAELQAILNSPPKTFYGRRPSSPPGPAQPPREPAKTPSRRRPSSDPQDPPR